MKAPIFITGCARSGTSMVAGIVERCGANGGLTCGPTPSNQKGQYEHTTIRNNLIKPYLRAVNSDPMGQNPLPKTKTCVKWSKFRPSVENIMRKDGVKADDHWYFKGAKLCLIWPMVHDAFPDAKWIIVRRPKNQIIESCLKTPFMRAYKGYYGWDKWVNSHLLKFEEMKEAGLNIREVWSNDLVQWEFKEIRHAIESYGLDWNIEAIKEFVTPSLYHAK